MEAGSRGLWRVLCGGTHSVDNGQGEKQKLSWRSRDWLLVFMTSAGHLTHAIWHCHPYPTHVNQLAGSQAHGWEIQNFVLSST